MKEFFAQQSSKLLSDKQYRDGALETLGKASGVIGQIGSIFRRKQTGSEPLSAEQLMERLFVRSPTKEEMALALAAVESSARGRFIVVCGMMAVSIVISLAGIFIRAG